MDAVETYEVHRMAFPFDPARLRRLLPKGVVGTYLLFENARVVYVGRSDSCLRRRLTEHNLIGRATHVSWAVCTSEDEAFLQESFWYHRLIEGEEGMNLIHPAAPASKPQHCPFCEPHTNRALARALSPNRQRRIER
jgi:hypothetical protein